MKSEEQIYTETISFFLNSRAKRNPCKTNLLRRDLFEDILNGLKTKEIVSKYGDKKSDPSQYLNKVINRFCQYAGMEKGFGLRFIRKGSKKA